MTSGLELSGHLKGEGSLWVKGYSIESGVTERKELLELAGV